MADRTSAALFASMFERFATQTWLDHSVVRATWADTWGYDFHPCQMDCNEQLITLGLAKRVDLSDGDWEIIYQNRDCTGWDE